MNRKRFILLGAGLPGHSGATGKLSVCHSSGEVAQPGAMHR
jgi:hypothetical protein